MNLSCKSNKLILIIGFLFLSSSIILLDFWGLSFVVAVIMIVLAIALYFIFSKKDLFNPLAIYSLFWLGGIGISKLNLSYDQNNWSFYFWLNLILAYVMFVLGYYFVYKKVDVKSLVKIKKYKFGNDRFYLAIVILFILCLTSFILEVIILRFIPLFSAQMEAYKTFHISGVHYFVVTVCILPSLTMIYKSNGGKKKILLINIISFLIPILIVSRQLIILQVVLVVVTYHYFYKKLSLKLILAIGCISIVSFSILSNLRHQNVSYIYRVAHMKTNKESIFTQPYLYVAMSFENLRNIIDNFHSYKLGQNILYPILAFTNTKGFFNDSYKLHYLTNEYFTVSTYLSDIYYDFGVAGVVIIVFLLGCIYSFVYKLILENKELSIITSIHGILTYCIIFSFFVSWFFNPSIWFYTIVILMIVIFCNEGEKDIVSNLLKRFRMKKL